MITLPERRRACPYECMDLYKHDGGVYVRTKVCNQPAVNNTGWCKEHAYCQVIMDLASDCGYPALAVNEALSIGRGLPNWEAYIVRHAVRNHSGLKKKLIELKAIRQMEDKNAVEKAIAEAKKRRQDAQQIA